ncbi:unnamed protein product [Cylindrotheca closterium]|uniref:Uncharacterized protein n=1 Tax=Cylindrotheca closterium TaxID=2856 RepID=A0AAD2JMD9_9STRA|nr:unnamed protein product [Cylindrotheca closterium]
MPARMQSSTCCRDMPMAMPTRKPSISSLPRLVKPLSKFLSSSRRSFSSDLSLRCLDGGYEAGDLKPSSSSFHLASSDELSLFSFATAVVIEADDEEEEERGVRFAPQPTTATFTCLCLDDYTPDELEACWFSLDDIRYMREKRKRKRARKLFTKKNKRLQGKILKREDTRWSV